MVVKRDLEMCSVFFTLITAGYFVKSAVVDWAMLGFSFEGCIVRCLESTKKRKTQSLLQGAEQTCLLTY